MNASLSLDVREARGEASIDDIGRTCMAMARRRAGLSALACFLPLPGIDLVTDVAVLTGLLADINRRFGLTETQIETLSPSRKALAYKRTTAAGGFVAGRLATSRLLLAILRRAGLRLGFMEVTRLAPVIGQAIAAVIAYVTLTRIAKRHIAQCAEIAEKLSG